MSKEIIMVDHFCGAGGESTGMVQAAEELGYKFTLHAHNHWLKAIDTHKHNHPYAKHLQKSIDNIDPVSCVKGKRVALMWASPECTHHSNASGGRPKSDQSRATAMCVVKWAQELYIDRIIVENVPEFLNWGPLGANNKPLQSGKGKTFHAWCDMLRSLGYKVDWKILRASDYGDPTTRKRLFVQAVRGNKKIVWPEPTHSDDPNLFGEKPWIPSRDIIDWSIPCPSIFGRKRPLVPNTLARIEYGIEKYWGEYAEPFLCVLRGTKPHQLKSSCLPLGLPVPTLTAGGGHIGLIEPLMLDQTRTNGPHSSRIIKGSNPIGTVTTKNRFGVIEPFIYASGHRSSIRVRSIDQPLSTVVTKAEHCIVKPLIVEYYGNGVTHPVSKPLPTVTCTDRFGLLEGRYGFDIGFRMLKPKELAAAQGFPPDYWFSGTQAEQVKQIGNAVPPGLAKALTLAALKN